MRNDSDETVGHGASAQASARSQESAAGGERVLAAIEKARTIRSAFEAVPHALFIVDSAVRILDCNSRGAELVRRPLEAMRFLRGGEVVRCLRHEQSPNGCGSHAECGRCVIRTSVSKALNGCPVKRCYSRMKVRTESGVVETEFLVSATAVSPTQCMLMLEDLSELLTLREALIQRSAEPITHISA